jgi:hypothetical protein
MSTVTEEQTIAQTFLDFLVQTAALRGLRHVLLLFPVRGSVKLEGLEKPVKVRKTLADLNNPRHIQHSFGFVNS